MEKLHFQRISCLILPLVALIAGESLQAQRNPDDVRESCRQEIGGLLLTKFDAERVAADGLALFQTRRMSALSLIKVKEIEVSTLRNRRDGVDYDPATTSALTDAVAWIEQLRVQVADYDRQITGATEDYAVKKKEFSRLKDASSKLFSMSQAAPIEKGKMSYGFEIKYRKPCPKHRLVCPLEKQESKDMEALLSIDPAALAACSRLQALSQDQSHADD